MRMYDPRIGRFPSVDPLSRYYPWYTPYQFAGNNPIRFIDLDGAEPTEPGKKEGEIRNGTNGQGPAKSWKWDGKTWQDNSALPTATVSTKRKTYDQIAKQYPQVPFAVSGAFPTALSLYIGKYNTYATVSSTVMNNLTEDQKQKDFKTNAAKTSGILIWEFLTGTGEEYRSFDESDPITEEIKW